MQVIITSPSLDPHHNVSGISYVTTFIINNNYNVDYRHFEIGKRDSDRECFCARLIRVFRKCIQWNSILKQSEDTIIHYNIPLMKWAILRDFLFLLIARKHNIPVVLHVHGGYYMQERQRPYYLVKVLKTIFSWSSSIIVLGEEEKKILEIDFDLKRVFALPNCVDLSNAKDFRPLFDTSRVISILFMGRIEKNKGIDYIYDSIKVLHSKYENVVLHFAGKEEKKGEFIPKFEQLLGDNFSYHGVVSGPNKNDLFKSSMFFILPSLYEGLPIALLEAMSYGLIPIVTDVGSISTVVRDGYNGLFIRPRNSDDIITSVEKVLNRKDYLEYLSFNAKSTIFDLFDVNKYIHLINELYIQANKG